MHPSLQSPPSWIRGTALISVQTIGGAVVRTPAGFERLRRDDTDLLVADGPSATSVLVRGPGEQVVAVGPAHLVVSVLCEQPAELADRWAQLDRVLRAQALQLRGGPVLWRRGEGRALIAQPPIGPLALSARGDRVWRPRRPWCV